MSSITGNKNVSSDFIRVLQTLKLNVMRDTHVADICKVTSTKADAYGITTYMCTSINDGSMTYQAFALSNLSVSVNNVVLVLFCDNDIRMNYKRVKSSQATQNTETVNKHSTEYGIIIGII